MTQELPEGTVTVLITDVVGSSDLTTSRGDEAAQEILRAQRDLVRQQIGEHSGHEVKGLGDGFIVAFASARRAVACAVGIQRALEEHNRGQPLDEQVMIRIGLNTGEVIEEEEDLFGETVNAAAVIGRSFTFELLEALGDADTDALLDDVDEAERANLIASTSEGAEERFTFAHELIRQTLLCGLSSPRRRHLHLHVAEAMEAVYASTLPDHAVDLAHHLDQAGTFADPQRTPHPT